MKRGLAFVLGPFVVGAALVPARAFAQTSEPVPAEAAPPAAPTTPAPTTPAPTTPAPRGAEASELLVPTPPEWRAQYDDARAKLATGDFEGAAARFRELEASAVNRVDRALAREQHSLAVEWAKRNLAFVHRSDAKEDASSKAVDRRSTDEIAVLYANATIYGIGSGVWVGTLTKPESAASAILPALALTGGSIGTVIALDGGRGIRYGVAQSIATGMWIGVEQGVAWTVFHQNQPGRDDLKTEEVSSIIWGLSTTGAVAGGVLGSVLGTTPGRSGWVGSTSLWTGTLAALATNAFRDERRGAEAAPWAALGIGSAVGTAIGLATASTVSPTIGRVRIMDLAGGLGGGLVGGLLYVAAAGDKANSNAATGVAAIGMTAGLVTTYLLTSSMGEDRLRTEAKDSDDEPKARKSARIVESMQPTLMPANGGAMMGVGGILQ